jgi:hypothetical protein
MIRSGDGLIIILALFNKLYIQHVFLDPVHPIACRVNGCCKVTVSCVGSKDLNPSLSCAGDSGVNPSPFVVVVVEEEEEEEEEEVVGVRFHVYICNVSSYCLFSKIAYDIPENSQSPSFPVSCQN